MGIKLDEEKGLTLLEVLLSIVLLVIVLTSFASFFTQSAMFVKKNEDKLSTTQTAQQIVNQIEVSLSKNDVKTSSVCGALPCKLEKNELSNLLGSPIASSLNISAEFADSVEGLIRVKVSVTDIKNPENSSETFTYIRR
ncbi:type IV pilus modification PilV family protein [Bacillus sp. JJ1609]|uniref:type IV pilus modification PilV family protein n=1 Tax=Bacillus sp. JJ1609 TaxID=3122977 RepID=UPI002FFE91C4